MKNECSLLTLSDLQKLAASFITPAIAQTARLERVDDARGRETVNAKTRKGSFAGLVFPYFWPGDSNPRAYRLRRDTPDFEQARDGSLKPKGKYLSAPGDPNRLYFAPSANPDWLSDVSIPAVITEGEKKTLALQRFFDERNETTLVIGLSGVWNWRGTVGKQRDTNGHVVADIKGVIPDIHKIQWEGRQVELLFDANAESNAGVKAARKALIEELTSLNAQVRVLRLPENAITRGLNGIDDFLGSDGAEAVAEWLKGVRNRSVSLGKKAGMDGLCFDVSERGVWALNPETGDRDFICTPLFIEADTRDEVGENWGRLLRFPDRDKREHQWAMPMVLLSGDGREYRQELLHRGVTISSSRKARTLLEQYLNTRADRKVLCVSRIGWHKNLYVLPDETIGTERSEGVFFQSLTGRNELLRCAGSLEEWRASIAAFCPGNSRLTLAVSAAFAASLLRIVEMEGGGIHFRGASSTGKTTALLTAGSVWGGNGDKGFLRRWRATGNALEAVAENHNDALLVIDELSEVDPREAGEVAYMLANGQGKLRQNKTISLRRSFEWRLLFLSSGEISLNDHIAQGGKRSRGGQEVRLVDVQADAGAGYGLFENLHSFETADELSRHLRQSSLQYYGTPIRSFLQQLVRESETVRAEFRNYENAFLKDTLPAEANGEMLRVAHRFALVGFAGELASNYGITGWIENESTKAAQRILSEWLDGRNTAGSDEEAMIRQVRLFIEQHGASRFQNLDRVDSRTDDRTIYDRAGYVESTEDGPIHYFLPEVFRKEVCKGFDATLVARALKKRECLLMTDGLQYQKRTPDGKKKMYAVTSHLQE